MLQSDLRTSGSRRTLLSLALVAVVAPLQAQENAAEGLISLGIGGFSGDPGDRALANQYSGLRTERTIGLLGVDYYRRNVETGTSTSFAGSHLFGENRELRFDWKKQGDWKFGADYSELVRRDPETVRTGLIGAGTTSPQVTALVTGPGSGSEYDLKIKRTRIGLNFSKVISRDLEFDIDVSSENKEGSRLFGSGFACPSAVAPGCRPGTGTETGSAILLMPEPIKANHTQINARVNYASGKLRMGVGYYGSFYSNSYDTLRPGIPGNLYNPVGNLLPLSTGLQAILSQPLALPPDNQAHHLDLSGTYSFSGTTHANFKLGYAQATQQQDFAASGLAGAPAGVANLGGKVNTTLAQIGLTSRPTPQLSLLAKLRYEDKDDQTPLALYNIEGTSTYTNRRLPRIKTSGTLQASYRLPQGVRATLGADGEKIDRGVFTASSAVAGITALRQKTEEITARAELRRAMGETFSGAIAMLSSRRTGSNWLRNNSGLGVTEVIDPNAVGSGLADGIFMPTLADRRRERVRLSADWQPNEQLILQFSAEDGTDRFTTPSTQGLRSTDMKLFNVDASFALSDKWNLNAYLSRGNSQLHQVRPEGYILSFDNVSTQFGLGVVGRPASKFELGGGLTYVDDRSRYQQGLDAGAAAGDAALLDATGGLPDILFRQTSVRLFGSYSIDKRSAVRVDIAHHRRKWNDWRWGHDGVPFVFADGTTVFQRSTQEVAFVGVTYIYRWQ